MEQEQLDLGGGGTTAELLYVPDPPTPEAKTRANDGNGEIMGRTDDELDVPREDNKTALDPSLQDRLERLQVRMQSTTILLQFITHHLGNGG